MPSPEISGSAEDWIQLQREVLSTYSDKIEACIGNSEWEMLAVVLESRKAFLQRLFSPIVEEQHRTNLKQLAESILQQDAFFQARVEEQKRIVVQQQMAIDHGRRAVQAYIVP